MNWYQVIAATPSIILSLSAIWAVILAFRRRKLHPRTGEVHMVALGIIWLGAASVQTLLPHRPMAGFLGQVQIQAVTVVPWMLVTYAANWADDKELKTTKSRILLAIVPSIMHILVLTNGWHGWVVQQRTLEQFGSIAYLRPHFGPVYAAYMVYCAGSLAYALHLVAKSIDAPRRGISWRPVAVLIMFVLVGATSLAQMLVVPFLPVAALGYMFASIGLLALDTPLTSRDIMLSMWQMVFDKMGDAVLVIDAQSRLVSMNPAAEGLIDARGEDPRGCELRAVWSGSRASLQALLNETSSSCDIVTGEGTDLTIYEVQVSELSSDRSAGSARAYVLRDVTIRRQAEDVLRRDRAELEILVTERTQNLKEANLELAAEVAQRRRVQDRLERSEDRFVKMFEHAPMAYYLSDLKGLFIDGNRAAANLLGTDRDSMVGKSFLQLGLLARTDVVRAARLLAKNALGKETGPDEFSVKRADGTRVPVEIVTVPVRIGDQTLVLGAVHDLTRRKAYEKDLRQARDELEQRVKERTAELNETNIALVKEAQEREHAQDMLRASLSEKEVLLKEIHHRVKNNLQIISSLLSLQSAELDDPYMLRLFSESEYRVRSMALIHEKLYRSNDLARINLREYADDLATYLHRSHGDISGRVTLSVDAQDVMLAVDKAVPCGLVLNELIINSFKHGFPDGRTGTIEVRVHENGDGRTHIQVADDGVGMPEDFDLEEATSLGMQLFGSLAEQLDAEIELRSENGTIAGMSFVR